VEFEREASECFAREISPDILTRISTNWVQQEAKEQWNIYVYFCQISYCRLATNTKPVQRLK
jgi:hypothetical protein